MNKNAKKIIAGVTAFGITLSAVMAGVMSSNAYAYRLGGNDRYQTATVIADEGWKKSDVAIVVRGEDFADALCAVPLAKMYDAPILLTSKNALPSTTKDKLKALGTKNIIIVGGKSAISASVEKELASLATVERIAGASRYETSVKVANKMGASKEVVLVRGDEYADAMSIASYAAISNSPIILTAKNSIPKETQTYLNSEAIEKTIIVGGKSAISASVESKVKGAERIEGSNRYETNTKIIQKYSNLFDFEKVYLALGQGKASFADALSGAALAAKTASPVIITYNTLQDGQKNFLKNAITPKTELVKLGGEKVVPENITNSLKLDVQEVKGQQSDLTVVNNIKIQENGTSLNNSTVKGNVYVYGDGAKLTNVKVEGTVFVDPGAEGNVTLDGVEANDIRVLSGAQNSIHLNKVTTNTVVVNSKNETSSTRVVVEKGSKIGAAYLLSSTQLENNKGDLKNVVIATVNKEKVKLSGFFKDVKVVKDSMMELAQGATVTNTITVSSKASLNVAQGATVGAVTLDLVSGEAQITGEGKINVIALINKLASLNVTGNLTIDNILAINKNKVVASDNLKNKIAETTMADINSKLDVIISNGNNSYDNSVNGGSNNGGGIVNPGVTDYLYVLSTNIAGFETFSTKLSETATADQFVAELAKVVVTSDKNSKAVADAIEQNLTNQNIAAIADKLVNTTIEGVPASQYLESKRAKYVEVLKKHFTGEWVSYLETTPVPQVKERIEGYINELKYKFTKGTPLAERIHAIDYTKVVPFMLDLEKELKDSKIPSILFSGNINSASINGTSVNVAKGYFTIGDVKRIFGIDEAKTLDQIKLSELVGKKLTAEVKDQNNQVKTITVELTRK